MNETQQREPIDLAKVINEGEKYPCESSNIKRAIYHEPTMSLLVEFIGGSAYLYEAVPRRAFDEFVEAKSKGRQFALHIKTQYQFRKVDTRNLDQNQA